MTDSGVLIAAFAAVSSFVLVLGFIAQALKEEVRDPARPPKSKDKLSDEKNTVRQLGERLVQAGLYRRNSMAFYFAIKVILVVIPIVGWLLASNAGVITVQMAALYGIMTAILGTVGPSIWLDIKKRRRQVQLRRSLPDAVDVIVICVQAGMSLPAALTRVSSELSAAHPMLAAELNITQREIQMGCTTGEALNRFADRFDVEELRSLASVVDQAEKYGASIVHALRVHADTLRQKRYQLAEERAQQAAVKLLIPTVLFIFPALFVVLLGPAVFDLYHMLMDMKERLGGLQ